MLSEFVELTHKDYPKQKLKLATIWLRDHCHCKKCFNHPTQQRLLDLIRLPKDLKIAKIEEKDCGELCVLWSDGHESEYCFEWLWKSQVENLKPKTPMKSWTKTTMEAEKYAKIQLFELLNSDDAVKEVVKSLITYGVAFINKVPPTYDMTEMTTKRMFPIMKTFFGEMHTFEDNPDMDIITHTDNTFFTDPAGLQVLHCICRDCEGGESSLVDGLRCVEELRDKNPKAFEILSKAHIPGEYIDLGKDQYHYHSAPAIRLCPVTGELVQFRWNVFDRAVMDTIPQEEMPEFYDAFIEMTKIIENEKKKWIFNLTPGTVMIINNWRVLHGRRPYTGTRKIIGCYVLRSEFVCKAKTLNLM